LIRYVPAKLRQIAGNAKGFSYLFSAVASLLQKSPEASQ
jgi:hypothetical protein